MHKSALTPLLLLVFACADAAGGGECAGPGDCRPLVATCAGCPEVAELLCVSGACTEADIPSVDVIGDVSLHRDIADSVRSIVHVVVATDAAAGGFRCEDVEAAGELPASVNVLSSGYKAVSGGAFHPEVTLGRVAAGEVAVVVFAAAENAGQGTRLGDGCIDGLVARDSRLEVGVLSVAP